VPDDRADAQADKRDQRGVGTGHQHGAQHARLAQRSVRGRRLERGLAGEERREGDDFPRRQRDRPEHRRLRAQHEPPPGYRGERRADHPGGELARDREHAGDPEQQLAEHEPDKAVVGRVKGRAAGGGQLRVALVAEDNHGQAGHGDGEERHDVPGGPGRAEFLPLHRRDGAETVSPAGGAGGATAMRHGGHHRLPE
jgi:hypothetical protein